MTRAVPAGRLSRSTFGFGAQSPTGDGTTAIVSDLPLTFERIANFRDGS
ncbi:hypothetical protein [Mesorhizobium sp. M0199]